MLSNFLDALKQKQGQQSDEETQRAMDKMKQRKRLSSEEFLRVYDALWQEGPSGKYQTPDGWAYPKNPV
jgi:hypothetical protein